jgi:hypothetical protein
VPGGFGPRFLLEAMFLVLVAVVAGLADLPTRAILLVMLAAWLLTAGIEWAASRERARAAREEPEAAAVVEGAGAAPPAGQRRRLWRRSRPEAPEAGPVEVKPPVTAPHIRVIPREPDPAAQPVLERPAPEPAALVDGVAAAPEPTPVPDAPSKPSPAVHVERPAAERAVPKPPAEVPVAAQVPEAASPPEAELPAEAPREPAPLAAVASPEPEPPAEPEPARKEVTVLPLPASPREWNVWDLERLTRAETAVDVVQSEEWAYLLMYLREYARPDGVLPVDFDPLVRESFGELLSAAGSR